MDGLKIGSLFSGIGGLELGLERAGLGRAIWQVEFDPGCRSVLEQWWPDADRSVQDVRRASRTTLPTVDLICGGFPCQDVSSAGLGRGLAGERSGLWYEYRRVVGELAPEWVVVENVASGAARWLPHVRHDLRALGYRSAAVQLSAADVGAPHQRERIFVVAHRDGERREGIGELRLYDGQRRHDAHGCRGADGRAVAHADGCEQQRRPEGRPRGLRDEGQGIARDALEARWREPQPGMGRDSDGAPRRVDRWPTGRGEAQATWEPPRTVAKTRGGNRNARLKALGNAVVPQCAEVVGRLISTGAIFEVLK